MSVNGNKKIAVVDFGGQYAHLIASKLRRLGAYSEIRNPTDFHADELRRDFSGLVLSGGPASVYDDGAPASDPALLEAGLPVLGICYGHQLMMKQAGGEVRPSEYREYGPATIEVKTFAGLFAAEESHPRATVWMSHGDEVAALPPGFQAAGATHDCAFAAAYHPDKKQIGIQFHPEVTGTERGDVYLRNFIRLCDLENSWKLEQFIEDEVALIQERVQDRKVFLLISGGVDSTVAFALLARALPHDHLRALIVDTGFMRHREVERVGEALVKLDVNLLVEDAGERYYAALAGVADPEEKRRIIGELFIDVQEDAVKSLGLNAADWYLGQGTIYPDTIESGATKHSHKIKTHHNRVARVEELLAKGQVVEPLRDLYKDEVRNLGRLLGLPADIVERHPFPGPGLAVRCLCTADEDAPARAAFEREIDELNTALADDSAVQTDLEALGLAVRVLPLRSVGVQGDRRSYAHPAVLYDPANIERTPDLSHFEPLESLARRITGRHAGVNRLLLINGIAAGGLDRLERRTPAFLVPERIELLRQADQLVHDFQSEKNIYGEIWQFPVVLAPLGSAGRSTGETIILRPINSTDAMTARAYAMSAEHRAELGRRLLAVPGVDLVLFDITSKPPGTIEWE